MSDGKRVRTLPWLRARSKLAFESSFSSQLVNLAKMHSPSGAYDEAYVRTGDMYLAKACRWLSMIQRDHGEEAFDLVCSSVKTYCSRPKSTNEDKGVRIMSRKPEKSRKEKDTSKSKKSETPTLPLKQIGYKASVTGVFSRVRCSQQFENDAKNPVEAVYVFPMPDEASVIACTMKIGKKSVAAELKEKAQAKQDYQQAIDAGHHASLLEQERPNVFTMNVGGIEPGEKISVEVDYIQRVLWQAGGGRFVVPLVVAPQFIPGKPVGQQSGGFSEDTDEVPDASRITPKVAREGVSYRADISVLFSPGFRCKLTCPSHSSIIKEKTVARADSVELKTGDILTDRDFTLVYKSLSKVAEVAVHTGEFEEETFLLANIIPPGDVLPVGTDVVMVLDCSGSMHGAKIQGLKEIAKKILSNLKKQDVGHKVGVVPFDNVAWLEHPISEISERTEEFIDRLEARGGTMLGFGLDKAKQLLAGSNRPKVILMVTDGDTSHARGWYGGGIRLVAVGIGTAVNDTRIKELARCNLGVSEFVYPGEDYSSVANRLAGFLSGPVLRDVTVDAKGDVVGVSDVFKGRPANIAVRFQEKPVKVKIQGLNPENSKKSWEVTSSDAKKCDFLAQIWARELIREKQEKDEQITASLKYGVICQHTSFVAVSLKKVPGKKPERVEIPVNLPVGWDYEAVFGSGPMMMFAGAGSLSCNKGVRGFVSSPTLEFGSEMRRGIGSRISDMVLGDSGSRSPSLPKIQGLMMPSRAKPVSSRFVLDSKNLVDKAFAILVAVANGKMEAVKNAFAELQKELKISASKLSAEKKAMLRYVFSRLLMYGFSIDANVTSNLTYQETDKTKVWSYLALKEEGRAPADKPNIPLGLETSEYLAWKLGIGSRPVGSEWSFVP